MSRVIGLVGLLVLCVALALLKALVDALAIALGILILVALLLRPRDTLLCLVTLGLIGLVTAKPLACIAAATGLATVVVLSERTRKPSQARQLPPLRQRY